jgi:hypothetical protein
MSRDLLELSRHCGRAIPPPIAHSLRLLALAYASDGCPGARIGDRANAVPAARQRLAKDPPTKRPFALVRPALSERSEAAQ